MEFIVLLLALGFVTLVGHGTWVLAAWVFRALAGRKSHVSEITRSPTNDRERCTGCGQLLLPWQEGCGQCGVDRTSQAAAELRELAIMARQLASLEQAGTLDSPTFQRVQSCIASRRTALMALARERIPTPEVQPKPIATPPVVYHVLPLWERLQQLLESRLDVSSLALKQRQQALLWYGQLSEDQLASLSPAAQLALARLLSQVRKTDDSLRTYRRLLNRYPHESEWTGWALEAGRFAADKKITDQACEFLEKALTRAESPEKRPEIERLLQSLRIPPKADIVDVLPVLEPPRAIAPPAPPRRTVAEVLAAFMEERNIFWGELVGGLLMVGCSIALVLYLWKDLERIPYFQFLIFVGTTAGVFGAGLYARQRLKLETTSRGLFVIATLLVPLNFLVMAGLAGQKADADPYDTILRVGIEIVSLALFGGLLNSAARALVPNGRWLLIVTVLGASASQLAVPRILGLPVVDRAPALLPFFLLGCLPVAAYGVGTGGYLYQLSARRPIDPRQGTALLAFLGLAAFPLIVALGFLVYWSSAIGVALERLAVLISLSGVPAVAGGLLVHRRLQVTSTPEAASAAAIRTTGTAVGLAGMLLMLAAVVLAWPQPIAMILVCALNFAFLTAVALRCREPIAHAIAIPCLTIGYLIAFHLLAGHLSSEDRGGALVRTLLSGQSGSALAVLVLLLGVAAEVFVRVGWRDQAVCYMAGAGVAALASLLLVNTRGLSDPGSATIVTGSYAAASLALNMGWRRPLVSYLGLALVLVTTHWALWWTNAALTPAWGTALALEALVMATVATLTRGKALTPAAWRDMAAVTGLLGLALALASLDPISSLLHTWTWAALAATALLLAWSYRAMPLIWIGSALLLTTMLHALTWGFSGLHLAHPAAVAHLGHATLVLLASVLLKMLAKKPEEEARERDPANAPTFSRIFSESLFQSAFVSSLAAIPLLFVVAWGDMGPLAVYLGWLSGVWLVIAWSRRWPLLFAAFQAALSGTVLLAATAWLEHQGWVIGQYPEALADPRSLQTYGIALSLLAVLWLGARFALRSKAIAQKLLAPPWPTVDWVVLGMVVLGQLGLAVWGILPGILDELTPIGTPLTTIWPTEHVYAYGFGAWVLLGVLASALVIALWEREQTAAVLGLVILAVTASILRSGVFEEELATASALRWALGLCFLVCSVPLWLRNSLTRLAGGLHCAIDPAAKVALPARGLVLASTVVPVLGLTLAVAVIGFSGQQPTGPRLGSFFADIGWVTANVMPLAMISLGLVGHALRERSPGYAFCGGLVVNLAVTGGYALALVTSGQALGEVECVRLLQMGSVTAALWAIVALASRPWVAVWREGTGSPRAGALMNVQLGLASAGNAWLLVVALALLVGVVPTPVGWSSEAGAPLGWLALVLAAAAWNWCREQRRSRPQPYVAGLIVMAALGLVACSVARQWPEWGYRALMLIWAGYAPVLVFAAWLREWQSARAPGQEWGDTHAAPSLRSLALSLSRALTPDGVAFWVRVVVMVVVLLGLKAALVHDDDHLWAAGAIALASMSGAAMAVWRRREDWAFTSGLGVNLAASLVVWYFRRQVAFADWWGTLLQANVIATASVALVWLMARKHLYGQTKIRLATAPLLATQVCVGLAGNVALLCGPLYWLITWPEESLPPGLICMGYLAGWLALGLTMAAAFWYASQVAADKRGHILAAFGVALGVLAACSASLWAPPDAWAAYHVLLAAWTGTGLAILAAERMAQAQDPELSEFSSLPFLAQLLAFSPAQFRAWLNCIGLLVLGLALRGTWEDPARPYWSAGATAAVSAMAGAVALRSHLPIYAHISGFLINMAGSLLWVAWGPSTPTSFAYAQVLCFALASGIWSALELTLRPRSLPGDSPDRVLPFRHAAALCALCLLGGLVTWNLTADVLSADWEESGLLSWTALGATLAALVLSLWDREATFSLSGLYAAGLAASGLALHTLHVEPLDLGWIAALGLAFYVLLTTALARLAPGFPGLWQELRLPNRGFGWPQGWFFPAQAAVAVGCVMLSVWLSLGAQTLEERLAAPLAVGILLPTGALLAGGASGRWAMPLRHATLVLSVLLIAVGGWAVLGPSVPGVWLHRNVLLMAATALMTLVWGVGLVHVLPPSSAWAGCARQLGPILGAFACILLLLVLGHEALLYDGETGGTAMMPWAIVIVAAALAGLIGAGIGFAVLPGRREEPTDVSQRARMLYVYASEGLLVLMFVHFRLTVPELFRLHIFAQYWTFIVMAIAFVGVGLSEFLNRRGLRVLAEPLERTGVFLPLLPLLSFWVLPAAQAQTQGLLGPANYGRYAALWFLAGSLYSLIAVTRRSFRFALSAALAANFGLWALLVHSHLDFLTHPQMWLIPFALIILMAEHVNHARLTEQQRNALRYLALLMVYLSSTADMFIAGLGQSVILPLALAVLSVLGVLSGILLRVRAFLYVGVTFLFLVVFTMIWHAAVGRHQIWVWWASGIVLGAAIILLFAIFEKRRNDVLRVIEDIKKWN